MQLFRPRRHVILVRLYLPSPHMYVLILFSLVSLLTLLYPPILIVVLVLSFYPLKLTIILYSRT